MQGWVVAGVAVAVAGVAVADGGEVVVEEILRIEGKGGMMVVEILTLVMVLTVALAVMMILVMAMIEEWLMAEWGVSFVLAHLIPFLA